MTTSFRIDDNIKKEHLPGRDIRTKKGRQDRIAETLTLNESFMKVARCKLGRGWQR